MNATTRSIVAAFLVLLVPGFVRGRIYMRDVNLRIAPSEQQPRDVQQQIATLDTTQYLLRYERASSREKEFINQLLGLYRAYKGRLPDTTLIALGDIDGNGTVDTLFTRVILIDSLVRSSSWLDRDGERVWKYELIDPAMDIADSDLYGWSTRNPWVTFTIGVTYPASLHTRDEFPAIDKATAIQQGLWHLNRIGVQVTEEEYARYLDAYQGLLLNYGHPEADEGLYIWYQPSKRFILYYHP
jgi:hypothetical protein